MPRTLLTAFFLTCLAAAPSQAQQPWHTTIFAEKSHDFGTVARGSKVRHAFKLVNNTGYDIHIADWRTKCGCTNVKVGARDIPTGTQTTIEATLDTTKFQGYKASGLVLVLDKPSFVEIDLGLTSFIRGDVMLSPGAMDFGIVPRGSKPVMDLTLNYFGGTPNWGITEVKTISPNLTATAKEISRSGGAVRYQLSATLEPSAPAGYFKDEITLLTNDGSIATIPVSVSANVQAAVSVAPGVVNLGHVKPGQVVKKTVLVRSSQKFKVTGANSAKPELKATGATDEEKPFHTLVVELTAPAQPGPFNAVLEIETNLKDEPPAKLSAFATVVP
jgi:hypothetical protein